MIEHNKPTLGTEEITAITKILQTHKIALGEEVKLFEKEFAKWMGVKDAAAVSSGTTALHLALLALDIKRNDEVIIPTYVCSAVLNAVFHARAKPVLVDVNKEDFNISLTETKSSITGRTKAIIIPHIYGSPVDIKEFKKLRIPIIEDCSQALGAKINNQKVGTFGDISITSFYATKLITTGHGGMIFSNNPKLVEKCRDLINFDFRTSYKIRYNYKMTDFQAAMGREQLKKIDSFLQQRESIAKKYNQSIKIEKQKTIATGNRIYYRYVIKVPSINLKKIILELYNKEIKTICPLENFELLHNYLKLNEKYFKNAEEISDTTISLPIYPSLKDQEIKKIITEVNKILKKECI